MKGLKMYYMRYGLAKASNLFGMLIAEGWLHLYAIHHALLEYADFINKVFTLGVDHEPEGFAIIC